MVLVLGEPATTTTALGIRDDRVLGLATRPGAGTSVTFLWNVHTGEVRTPALPRGFVAGVSANGWFAAYVRTSDPGARTPTGFSALVHTISADGRVLAGTEHPDDGGASLAVVWTCR